jgi:hypothetical protein
MSVTCVGSPMSFAWAATFASIVGGATMLIDFGSVTAEIYACEYSQHIVTVYLGRSLT